MNRIKKPDQSGRTTYELPPGRYWLGCCINNISEDADASHNAYGLGHGFYKSKSGLYYAAISSLDYDGAYNGSDGKLYDGCTAILHEKLCKVSETYPIGMNDSPNGKFITFNHPFQVTLTHIGDNFGINGIEINSTNDNFHLKVIENDENEDEDEN